MGHERSRHRPCLPPHAPAYMATVTPEYDRRKNWNDKQGCGETINKLEMGGVEFGEAMNDPTGPNLRGISERATGSINAAAIRHCLQPHSPARTAVRGLEGAHGKNTEERRRLRRY